MAAGSPRRTRKPATAANARAKSVAVRVLPHRTLSLDRTYLALAELELPEVEAQALIEQGIVQLASDELPPPPRMVFKDGGTRCLHCGEIVRPRPEMTPEDIEAGASWTH